MVIWMGLVEDDGYNWLVLMVDFVWCDVVVLCVLLKYLWQVGILFFEDYMWLMFNNYLVIVVKLVELFYLCFNLDNLDKDWIFGIVCLEGELIIVLEDVFSLDDDWILCWFQNVIVFVLCINFYQLDG